MKYLRRASVMSVLFLVSVPALGDGPGWQADFEQAETIASENRVPLLVHFHASWCGPCRQMDRQVFSSPTIQRALQEGLVAVQVETSARPDLAQRFDATTIPRDVVVYPDGAVETLGVGFIPQSSYLARLRDTAARGRVIALAQREAEEPDAAQPNTNSVQPLPAGQQDGLDEETVGLSGYCPVMLTGLRQWIVGRPEITERHRGVLYYFSSEQRRATFHENPDRYAPRNLGCDPVVLSRDHRAITGRIRYGVFFDGNLYLFRTSENREEFRREPLRYTRIQHAIRVDELTGQTFR